MTKLNFVGAKHLLPIALALTMCACGGGGTKPASDKAKTTETAPSEKGKKAAADLSDFTAEAQAKMKSLKTVKDKCLVVLLTAKATPYWSYSVYNFEGGKLKSDFYYRFYPTTRQAEYKEEANDSRAIIVEQDDKNLWYSVRIHTDINAQQAPTWQEEYDREKDFPAFEGVSRKIVE